MAEKNKKTGKKNIALAFGISKDYTFALANTLIGLVKNNRKFWDDIIVFHDGISKEEQKSLNEIISIRFINLSESKVFCQIAKSDISTIKKYSIATFYRYECLNLLNEYHKVIWNDVDILIRDDISDLINFADKEGIAFSSALPNFVVSSSLKKMISGYKMFKQLWNVGIMVVSDRLVNYQKIYEWCIEKTIEYDEKLLWPDLAILNIMLQEFNIEPENIDIDKYVCLPSSVEAKEALILHAYGDKKFWNDIKYMKEYPEWIENAKQWSAKLYKNIKDTMPLVSCVMSCYERYDYLDEAIGSILAQSYANFELIIVLEKSTKQKEIEEFIKKYNDPRIIVVNNTTKLGFSESLNVGIKMARGKYIARMDDDDISLPTRFAKQVYFLENNQNVGIVGSSIYIFGKYNGLDEVYTDPDYIKAYTLIGAPFRHPTVMMNKKILEKNNLLYDKNYFTEDYELWSRLVYKCDIANIREALVFYRSHSNQATSSSKIGNEIKIHASHKKIMHNQFERYLNIDLDDNELELLQQRINKTDSVLDKKGIAEIRNGAIEKIIKSNRLKQVYNENALMEIIACQRKQVDNQETKNRGTKSIIKKSIKTVVKPIYVRLLDRVEKKIDKNNELLRKEYWIQMEELKNEIKAIKDERK